MGLEEEGVLGPGLDLTAWALGGLHPAPRLASRKPRAQSKPCPVCCPSSESARRPRRSREPGGSRCPLPERGSSRSLQEGPSLWGSPLQQYANWLGLWPLSEAPPDPSGPWRPLPGSLLHRQGRRILAMLRKSHLQTAGAFRGMGGTSLEVSVWSSCSPLLLSPSPDPCGAHHFLPWKLLGLCLGMLGSGSVSFLGWPSSPQCRIVLNNVLGDRLPLVTGSGSSQAPQCRCP